LAVRHHGMFGILPTRKLTHKVARFRQVNQGKLTSHHDALEFPDGEIVLLTRMCPRRGDRATHSDVRRPTREGATVARYRAPGVRRARAEAGFDRQLIGPFTISLRRRKQVDAHPRRRRLRLDAWNRWGRITMNHWNRWCRCPHHVTFVTGLAPSVESGASAAAPSGVASTGFSHRALSHVVFWCARTSA
jgi:hypothetical protein